MKALIELPEPDVRALDRAAQRRGASRAALVRAAVADWLARHEPAPAEAFGLWGPGEDGVATQRRLREEW